MSTADVAVREEALGALVEIGNQLDQLAGTLNRALTVLPATTTQGVLSQWSRVLELWDRLREMVETMADAPGGSWELQYTAGVWNERIGGYATAIAARPDESYTKVQHYWEGEAVEAYTAMLPAQRDALERIKTTFSDPISSMLAEMAAVIEKFWRETNIILHGVIAAVVVCAVAAWFNPPGALATIVGAIVGAAYYIGDRYGDIKEAATVHQNLLHQKLHDNIGYPEGGWPRGRAA